MDLDRLFEHQVDVTGDPAEWARTLPGGGGVYLLTDEQDRVVLLAGGEGLRRAVAYRLAPPPEASKKRADLKAVVRRVRWRRTHSAFETAYEYHRIARILTPGRYLDACAFGPAWFVLVDPAARLPRITVAKYLTQRRLRDAGGQGGDSGPLSGDAGTSPASPRSPEPCATSGRGAPPITALGPFPTRTAAERFIEILQDLFDLCRYHHILEQAPHGQPCAYFEMGKCPAPCSGAITLERYREMVAEAALFGAGGWRREVPRWQEAMRAMAGRQEFEQAGRLKQRLQRAELLGGRDYRFVRRVEELDYLILQRGEGTTHVQPFLMRGGWIERGGSVPRKGLAAAAAGWVQAMAAAPSAPAGPEPDPGDGRSGGAGPGDLRSEWVWLVSHYLFKGDEAPGLFLGPDEWPRVEAWLPRVAEKVLRVRPPASSEADVEAEHHACPGSSEGGVASS